TDQNKLRVLIAEDSEDDTLLIVRELKRGGYEPVFARVETEKEMREALGGQEWDIIISDYKMPSFSGLAALGLYKESGLDAPFIVVSGTIGEELAVEMMVSGAHDYVMKGDHLVRLVPAVQRELKEAQVRSEKRISDRALRENEEVMRYIINYDPNAIAVYDRDLHYIAVSKRYLQDYNVKEENIIGKHHYEVFPEMPQKWKDIHQQCLAGEVVRNDDDYFERPDGSITYNRWECRPWYRSNGEIGGMITYTEVTTERKKAEIALMDALAFQQQLVDALPLPVFYKDAGERYLGCNKAFEKFFGTQRKAITGKTAYDVSPKDIADIYHEKDLALLEAPETIQIYESVVQDIRGIRHDVIFHKAVFRTIDGAVGGIIGAIIDVTALRKADAEIKAGINKLRHSEETLSAAINATNESLVLIDRQGIVLLSNTVAAERLEKSVPDLRGTCLYDHFSDSVAKTRKEQFDRVFDTGESAHFEDARADRHFELYVYPVRDEDGHISRVAIFARDITARKKAQESLRESEEKYRSIFENVVEGIFQTLPEGRFLSINPAMARIYGFASPEEMITDITNIGTQIYVNPGDRKKYHEIIEKKGTVSGFEIEAYKKDKSIIWVSINARAVKDHAGNTRYFEGTVEDITKRKKMEQQLKQSENLLKAAQSIAKVGGWEYDVQSKKVIWTDEVYRIYNVSESFDPNDIAKAIRFYAVEDRQKIEEAFTQAVEQHRPYDLELKFVSADRTRKWVRTIGRPLVKDGRVVKVVGNIADITDRKNAVEELNISTEKLRKNLIGTIQVISVMLETRDPYTGGHQKRVSRLARSIAQEMRLSKDAIDIIRIAGSIHDIGKMSVPAEILSKPTKLSDIEMSILKVHPRIGSDIIKVAELPDLLTEMVLQHHERIDGSGYPQGLKGEEILLEAQILAVADVVEAMASHRPYRPSLGVDAALEEIEKNKDIFYHPEVAEACLRLFRENRFKFE
ncbi:MAG: PAS domain S-box protein, partial [Syntrophorhabdaceae bacterium]|nr:PAS domain S-box protein [Syntrophorhabdaceae bacterium]